MQQCEVVGALEFWPKSRPKVWFRNIHVAKLVVGLCNKGCIRGMGGEGVREGRAVVGWMKVGEAGVHNTRAGALFCGVPWVLLSKLL